MKLLLKFLALLALLATAGRVLAKEAARTETLFLFQNHRVTISVPEGYVYSSGRDERGIITAKLVAPKQKVELQVSFQPDPDGRLTTEAGQMAFLAQVCRPYVDGSVERSYHFKSLEPHRGSGTYCVFTDASLVGREPPKGEFLNITASVKVASGVAIIFTLLSTDTTSNDYQTALKLLKESFESPAPAASPTT
ncbi:MAG: hypothetical protein EXS32_05890 [Opitutus sp.]|nr:hypothetical protein [Opitutus sp.]